MRKNGFTVKCSKCGTIAGRVEEVEARPGVFVNKSEPEYIPTTCPCMGVLIRIQEDKHVSRY